MAAPRGYRDRSSYSSRSASPVSGLEPERPYDPFDPPLDPIEMSNFGRHSLDGRTSDEGLRGLSPGDTPLSNLAGHSYFPPSSNAQYAQIPDRNLERAQTELDPDAPSINTNSTGLGYYKTKDVHTQALVDRRAGEISPWHIHWKAPASALGLFVAGVVAAIGHHLFYTHLNGSPSTAQLMMVRYGTALAFLVKTCFVGTVVLCFRQRIWHTLRQKAMTVYGIDGLFAVTEDPTQLMNLEMVWNAKLATIMAICAWLIPLASVLSPSALTSEIVTKNTTEICANVSTLNFQNEATFNFRNESNYPGSSLIYYNTTDTKGTAPGFFDYWDQASKNAKRLTITGAYLKKPAQDPNASLNSCGSGYNCTYEINFEGPGYKCDEIANSSNPNTEQIMAAGAPFNITSMAPNGNYLYQTQVMIGDYANPQTDTDQNGVPKPGYPDTLGEFQIEPALWIGYAVNTSKAYPADDPHAKQWVNVHEPHIFKCIAYHTNYTFLMQHTDGIQNATRKQRDFLTPVVDTNTTMINNDPLLVSASPASNYVSPKGDVGKYKVTAVYHALGLLLRAFLQGDITYDSGYPVTKSDISETRLVNSYTAYPVQDLMEQIQSVYEDQIMTLLSEPHLTVADTASVTCTKSRTIAVYVYHKESLWIGYAIVVAVAFAALFIGAYSIWQNGVTSDTQFSRIMVTTRNPTIDRISMGACLGGDPFPRELRETKLRFGVLEEEDVREGPLGRVEHCAFGAWGETKEIKKGAVYAGLAKYRRDEEQEVGDGYEKRRLLDKVDEEKEQ